MQKLIALAFALLVAGFGCLTQAQVSMTGAGLGAPTSTPSSYTGPGDVVSGAKGWWGLRGYNTADTANAANVCLPADSVCADLTLSSGNVVVPGSLSTCNNSTVVCTVKTLYDKSGALNCAGSTVCNVTQATINDRPKFVAALAANGCPSASLPCMSWAGTTNAGLQKSGFGAIAQALTFSTVVNLTSAAATGGIVACFDGSSGVFVTNNASSQFDNYAGSHLTKALSTSTWYDNQSILNGGSSSITLNNGAATSGAAGAAGCMAATTVYVGWDQFNNGMAGKTVEYGIWSGAFNGTQISNMSSNQHAYWGF